ncbi:hypothetical protein BSKO_11005 [Bryopsis sp. KO-2023]|nr:hypothetical protein BSKO_11005 [Bryopsis sp. KO-2023]
MSQIKVEVAANAPERVISGIRRDSEAAAAHVTPRDDSSDFRQVRFRLSNDELNPPSISPFVDNYVRTAKYTFYNFLVINLFQQFSRVANLYFLLIAVLQLIPGLSPTHWFTTVAPLVFVLIVNAVKEIYDDYYRHKSDDEVNNRKVDVLSVKDGIQKSKWKCLQVGDVVRIMHDEEVPADVVFLSSSDKDGLCYVETANLDGETNLKLKYSYGPSSKGTSKDLLTSGILAGKYVECEVPNERLYQFEGSMVDSEGNREGLDISNLVLRGCTLRKTDWIIGVVVFAGLDTKIQRNQSIPPRKVTQLEQHMNFLVVFVFFVQVALAIMGAVGRQIWMDQHGGDYYLEVMKGWPELGAGWLGGLVTTLRFIILLNQLIPISLYVTLEVVKVIQCLFLNWDRGMYCKEEDTPFVCRTTTLNEDLGQVEYILSDKTGTLTQNVMGFVWVSIGGRLFGANKDGAPCDGPGKSNIPPNTPHSIAFDANLNQLVSRNPGSTPVGLRAQAAVDEFFVNLAVCNTVVPTISGEGELQYQAESPDEEALVQGAAYLGYRLLSRSTDQVEVEVHGEVLSFAVLAVLEFNSDRKRMSILCRCPDDTIRLFCKGADTVIMERLSARQPCKDQTTSHLGSMAKGGFRTLAISQKEISKEYYKDWQRNFHKASVSLTNREEKIARMAEEIETELMLLGATAVEDKLQVGVPDAIAGLSRAGIKLWVLTGDKLETAVTISRSCNLFTDDMQLEYIREADFQSKKKVRFLQQKYLEIEAKASRSLDGVSRIGLVIEGAALAIALQPEYQDLFLDLCKHCRAVVCCRVSPIQKAQVTNLVKQKAGAITLAIGDGANDVGMIQAAHIGVGISGREGRAAVLASDFSMCQFAFLKRLLLVHGRWSYKRNSEVVLYAFYKNFAYCLANVYLNFFWAGFSSQPIYGSALIATYNVFWTSLPTMAFAILEQDVKADTVMKAPELYMETMLESRKTFFLGLGRWLMEAVWHSVLTYVLPVFALSSAEANGKMIGLDAAGVAIYTAVIMTVNLKVVVRTQHWTAISAFMIFFISIFLWFPFVAACSYLWEWYGILPDMSGVAARLFNTPSFWLSAVIGAPLISILLDVVLIAFQNRFLPGDHRIYQEKTARADLPDTERSDSSLAPSVGLVNRKQGRS